MCSPGKSINSSIIAYSITKLFVLQLRKHPQMKAARFCLKPITNPTTQIDFSFPRHRFNNAVLVSNYNTYFPFFLINMSESTVHGNLKPVAADIQRWDLKEKKKKTKIFFCALMYIWVPGVIHNSKR